MKICLYSPYIPQHTGGGEKYLLDVALALASKHQVSIAVPAYYAGDASIISKYEKFLNHSLESVSFIPSPLGSTAHPLKKLWWTRQFDVLYYLTDGSLFLSLAKRNILHIQFPLKLDKSSFWEQLKLKNWQVVNTNSEFTKQVVEPSWPVKVDQVHHPLVNVAEIEAATADVAKEKIILSVGRFFRHLHSKRQDVMVEIFRTLINTYPSLMKGWKLVFIGSVEDPNFLTHIKRKKRGLPVEFYHNLSRQELLKWYGRASLYWHAAGFGVNAAKHPEKLEHFGISTAEAMAAKAAPVVYGQGGQREVIGRQLTGLMWQTQRQAVALTHRLIKDKSARNQLGSEAQHQVEQFGYPRFKRQLLAMVEGK